METTYAGQRKTKKKKKLQYAEDATLNRDICKTPRELKIDLTGYYLARGEIEKAVEVADKMSDNNIIEKLHYLTKDGGQKLLQETEVDSFTNIKTLKETTDKMDKLYIYKMNCESVSEEPSYIFKTSTKALEIAKKLEQKETEGQPTNSLSLEWAYMDGMHSRVRGYKTLTLWTYHPGMNKVMALAIMECQNENTQMIKHLLQIFNKCLQDYTGIDDYRFDPNGIMCDEGGTNMNTIEEVFGKEFMAHQRVVICQWHFKSCARRQLPGIDKDEQKSFENLIAKLCECYTRGGYEQISGALKDICD